MRETKREEVQKPHDRGYKRDLSNPDEFLHFLQKYVNAEWTRGLKSSQLKLCDKEFVDKDYEGREADLIYSVFRNDESQIYLFVLQELQSTVDYTMVFRVFVYVFNNMLRYFLACDKNTRESKDFRLPAMVPIVFYNGTEKWTAKKSLREYQCDGDLFGEHILNMEYYFVDLSQIEDEYILSTNTVIDNIMYCDQARKQSELSEIIKIAYERIKLLGEQEREEFDSWVRNILLPICQDKRSVIEEIVRQSGDGEEGMTFKYNITRMFEEEREEGRQEGIREGIKEGIKETRKESILEFLAAIGEVPIELREKIESQTDDNVLKAWFRLAIDTKDINRFSEKIEV